MAQKSLMKYSDLNFVMMGDEPFYFTIHYSAQKIKLFYPDAKLWIYDWGFSKEQISKLRDMDNVILVNWRTEFISVDMVDLVDWEDVIVELESRREIAWSAILKSWVKKYIFFDKSRWENLERKVDSHRKKEHLLCQKPFCMLDCINKCKGKLVFLDGDAFLVNTIDEIFESDFEVGLTLRRLNELSFERNNCQGLNSGVIFFNGNSEKSLIFIEGWIEKMRATDEYLMEQTSLTRLISEQCPEIFRGYFNEAILRIKKIPIKIKILPCEIYNYNWVEEGVNIDSNKILHFKGGRHTERKFYKLIDRLKI